MVTLGIGEDLSSDIKLPQRQSISLRDSEMWYPEIPPCLNLNDDPALGQGSYNVGYAPLLWTLFGGVGGSYLRSVTGISVALHLGTPYCIEVHYNTDNVPFGYHKLGRIVSHIRAQANVLHFPIDGPGGETIEAIKAYLGPNIMPRISKIGAMEGFKVSPVCDIANLSYEEITKANISLLIYAIDFYKSREVLPL